MPRQARRAPAQPHPRRLLRGRYLRGTGRAHRFAARLGQELDPSRPAAVARVPGTMNTNSDDLARDPPDDDVLAAELVLGVLATAQCAAAQARVLAEPAFAARVAAWEHRLGGLVHEVDPVAVPAHVWPHLG